MLPRCGVCAHADDSMHLVPDREVGRWAFWEMCPLCLDDFLSLFPLHPRRILNRELDGRPLRRVSAGRTPTPP